MSKPKNLLLENAQMLFRNFSGESDKYNPKGDRNFVVVIDDDLAKGLLEDGWNVKRFKPQDGEQGDAYIHVTVAFAHRPPKIVLINSQGRTILGEDDCNILDWVDIQNADMILSPYSWSFNGNSGVKAYLKSLFITQDEDELELKYAQTIGDPEEEETDEDD